MVEVLKMNKFDQIIWWVWVAISILVCFLSLNVGVGTFSEPGPGLFPFVFAIFLGSASIIYLITSYFKQIRNSGAQIKYEELQLKRPGLVILFLLIYSLFLTRIGYLVSTFFLLFFLFNTAPNAKREWKLGVIGALATVVISYIIFNKLLQIPLPKGILGF